MNLGTTENHASPLGPKSSTELSHKILIHKWGLPFMSDRRVAFMLYWAQKVSCQLKTMETTAPVTFYETAQGRNDSGAATTQASHTHRMDCLSWFFRVHKQLDT